LSASTVSERYFAELPALKSSLSWWLEKLDLAARAIDPSAVISGRVKSHRSTLGKIYRRGGVARSGESLGDLVALKAIFPTKRGVDEFTEWLSGQSQWLPHLDVKQSAPDELKYQSKQFDLASDETIDSTGAPIKIEVQVRTAVADAWYVVDHRLRYKGTVALPDARERKLFRLIVLTELFDEEVEAVYTSQAALSEYAVARLYESLTIEADELIDGYAKSSRPEALLELVLGAYKDSELPDLQSEIGIFLAEYDDRVRLIVKDHLHDSSNFVEDRDWLYYEPETLLIAERALNKPALILDRIRGSDFEPVLTPMINEFASLLSRN
jgi:ppGpp synthetase/RelA/SpoT-type nucleotidyltranferase